jgi:hypothetical protein
MPINVCPSLTDLVNALVVRDQPVVVACDERKQHFALKVVAILGKLASRVPLVVLAEEPDFGEYYYLINHGAIGYFQIGEDPEHIARGIAHAALAG